jgi:hypothetical protein
MEPAAGIGAARDVDELDDGTAEHRFRRLVHLRHGQVGGVLVRLAELGQGPGEAQQRADRNHVRRVLRRDGSHQECECEGDGEQLLHVASSNFEMGVRDLATLDAPNLTRVEAS